ncbi:GatB/YqeY domain-containing protein [candidate division KSB3 bacterium]|uniref:GatB/YqeY domain-containing protein n=1 Tax=candidate division KSB3 bacterium TaxID=2044937 RepID=A0A9D5Q5B7_9BACT|nr:GatB/YqeY domain-containing protein [candidate division KSB3 bacterium]MBD3324659.1 GatB/YqeY domain-containing protein [candidate division KSB3 bacterium]
MTLKDQLTDDMKTAMKQKDKIRLATIRLVRSAIKNREIETGQELNDAEVIQVISTLVKQHHDSIEQFQQGGREELVAKEQAELAILETYLPEQLSTEELQALVQEAIAAVDATSMKEMGRVMKYIMPKVQGKADGKVVNQLVKEQLSS